jgi:hypothetical protein
MIQTIKTPISVKLVFDHKKRRVFPSELLWEGRAYKVKQVGLHYSYKNGTTLYHTFAVSCGELSFKLVFDTATLFWAVEEISDGLPD